MRFEFATAGKILFGEGVLGEIGGIAQRMGKRLLVVLGKKAVDPSLLLSRLDEAKIGWIEFRVDGEPTIEAVNAGLRIARDGSADMVLGMGGGSVLDAGKAIAALRTNPGEVLEYLEVIGQGRALANPPLPYIAIPTTSGTGSEVTRNAVLASPAHKMKISLRSPLMLPRAALVDPELTYSLPPDVTARTGMDALTQVIEPFLSTRSNPISDALCLEGMRRGGRSLLRAFENGEDAQARQNMALCSLLGGLALANAGLGAVHGFASPIGGMYSAPHGAICARLLPLVHATNLRALRERDPENAILSKFDAVGRLLVGDERATADDGVRRLEELCEALRIPRLSAYGITPGDIPSIVEKSLQASSMKTNPIRLSQDELAEILERGL
ncbi:MAG: iron-containing alcohol dehydrogenase [Chloroflexi bacterium]|nr:iron-containing alcohol dehydrogenase [Chloroflexota bacterium]